MEPWVPGVIAAVSMGFIQVGAIAFSYGKLWQRVDDMCKGLDMVKGTVQACPTCNQWNVHMKQAEHSA